MIVESSPALLASGAPLGRPRKKGKRTLAKLLRERGAFSTAHAVDVALDICDALAPAHANGVMHGQLGLDCVRLAFTSEAGPSDLEIFTLAGEDDSGVAGVVAPFLGPERRDRDRPVDALADVWALGALLHTMLVNAPPSFSATGAVAVPPETMPLSLAAVVEACLAPDPVNRPQTVDEIAEKIASFASSPPSRFVRLAERRERREHAERVRQRLERSGLAEMPGVLDKLDDAALARAQRDPSAAMSSVLLVGPTTQAALERLMTAVHEGTDAARVELASGLPALVDFDDEDDDVLPTTVQAESAPEAQEPIVFPLSTPIVLPELSAAPQAAPLVSLSHLPPAVPGWPIVVPRGRAGAIASIVVAALAISLGAGYAGYALSARASAPPPAASAASAQASSSSPSSAPSPAAPSIPVFAASALPEAPPVTPESLQEAKR